MLRVGSITPRTGQLLIALLLLVKLLLLVWNAAVFDGRSFDTEYHADRAVFGGLKASRTTHDGPLYYLPARLAPRPYGVEPIERATAAEEGEPQDVRAERPPRLARAEKAYRAELLDLLRYTNVLWLGAFYGLWIYWLFPRLLRGFQPWFLASLLLLALPGYQKLGVVAHPDNLFAATSALSLAAWLFVRERWQGSLTHAAELPAAESAKAGVRWSDLLLFAFAIGLMAATRWFAIVPAAVLSVVCLSYAVRSARGDVVQLALRAAAVLAVIGVLGLSWQSQVRKAARAQASDHAASYFPQFAAERSDFNYGRYYASFRVKQLLDGDKEAAETTVVNSFFTLLYSETWGDQWSTFANPRARDGKGSAKRALLGAALAVPPLSVALAVAALAAFVGRARKQTEAERPPLLARLDELEPKLLLLALVVCGGAAFVIWQGGPALLPGDNSTVKFGYLATLIPPAIALLFAQPLRRPSFQVLSGYFLALYVIAFPVAMYYPK